MSDLVERLRHTAGHLINGEVEDGAVECAMLCDAATALESAEAEIARLKGMLHLSLSRTQELCEAIADSSVFAGAPDEKVAEFLAQLQRSATAIRSMKDPAHD